MNTALTSAFHILDTESGQTLDTAPFEGPRGHCAALEVGGVIVFPESPFEFPEADRAFLLGQKQLESPRHKNIAYRPAQKRLTGVALDNAEDQARLHDILFRYSAQAEALVQSFLAPYQYQLDYASFRPLEEEGRKLRLRARNDLLHVDSFPTRPTYGDRIFRVFTNIHPTRVRVWETAEPFEPLSARFRQVMRPYRTGSQATNAVRKPPSPLVKLGKLLGLKRSGDSPYDAWMMDFHNFLKENADYQATTPKTRWEFAPGSSWMVFTDTVSHSVLSGQYALEQTFLIDKNSLVLPEKAPIQILQRHAAS